VSAVVVFYFLAGSVVARLWQRLGAPGETAVKRFLVDRFWRIAPMYYFVLAVSFGALVAGAESYFLSGAPSFAVLAQNLLVLPLNYYMYSGVDTTTLIPPAWSLAVELQVYLLMPLLLLHRWALLIALAASLVVFGLAQGPWLSADVFGYRLLPGVLFVFLCGALMASGIRSERRLAWVIWAGICGFAAALFFALPQWHAPFNREVALGFAVGVPLVHGLALVRFKGPAYRANRYAGVLSYGVFLAHFPVIWLYELALPTLATSFFAVLVGSAAVAGAGHVLVEKPLWRRFRATL